MHKPKCLLAVLYVGGATIHQLQAQSGAHIELDRGPPQSDNERVFIIRGNAYCTEQCIWNPIMTDINQSINVLAYLGGVCW